MRGIFLGDLIDIEGTLNEDRIDLRSSLQED